MKESFKKEVVSSSHSAFDWWYITKLESAEVVMETCECSLVVVVGGCSRRERSLSTGVGERLRCGQFPKSSSVKAVRKEVVARRRCGVLLLFNRWLVLSLRKNI